MISAIFDLQVTPILLTKFRVYWPFGSGNDQNKFSRWRQWWPSCFSDRNDCRYFLSASHPDTSSQVSVNWPVGSGEEAQNRFSRWRPCQPFWISDRNDFSYFRSANHPGTSYQVSVGLSVQEKFKEDFQDGCHGH